MSQKTSGLKSPTKIGKPSGLPKSGLPTPGGSRSQSAIEKSARAAGLSSTIAENYAQQIAHKLPSPEPQGVAESGDDFIIGDRVYVGGTKPGHIAFMGETRFAPGEWAGVVLDQAVGKNDGSVAGVRYFQCASKHGVFSRIAKLTREFVKPEAMPTAAPPTSSMKPPSTRGVKPPSGLSTARSISGSTASLSSNKPSPSGSVSSLAAPVSSIGTLRVGDRVLVSGTKPGVLRYLGTTDFAKGEWAGVELDDPLGKNDGAVAGKRYFNCRQLHGLFAPVGKVVKSPTAAPGGAHVLSTPSATPKRRPSAPGVRSTMTNLSCDRSGSQDSISSVGSNTSSVSRSRTPRTNTRPGSLGMSATTQALQKALKEKDEHIEQLLKERELERSEVARAASQCDEAENMLLLEKNEHQSYIEQEELIKVQMTEKIANLEQQVISMQNNVDEEKRKVEDLQFTIEEEAISKDDLEEDSEKHNEELRKMEKQLDDEKAKTTKLEQDLQRWKGLHSEVKERHKDAEDSSVAYLEKIEELTHLLNTSEDKLLAAQDSLQVTEKQLQAAEDNVQDKESRVKELEGGIEGIKGEHGRSQGEVEGVKAELEKSNSEVESMKKELQKFYSEMEGVKNELEKSKGEGKTLEAEIQKSKCQVDGVSEELERSKGQLDDMMVKLKDAEHKLSAANKDQIQVSELNSELTTLQSDLHHGKAQIGVLEAEVQSSQQLKDEAEEKWEKLQDEHSDGKLKITQQQEQINDLTSRLSSSDSATSDLQTELQSLKSQLTELQTKLGLSDEKASQLDEDKNKLKKQISELMQNSGNSSEQLNILNEKLQDSDRKIATLQADLCDSTQKVAKVQTEKDEAVLSMQQEMKALQSKHEQDNNEKVQHIETMNVNIEKLKSKSAKLKENLERENEECVKKKDDEIKYLQEKLTNEEAAKSHVTGDLEVGRVQIEKLHKENSEMEMEKLALENKKRKIESDNVELLEKLRTSEELAKSTEEDFKQKISKVENEKSMLQADWTTEREAATNKKAELNSEISSLNQKLEDLKSQLSNIESQKLNSESKLEEFKQQAAKQDNDIVADLRTQLQDLEDKNTFIEEELVLVKTESEGLKSGNESLKLECQAFKSKSETLTAQHEKLQQESGIVSQELNDEITKLESTNKQLTLECVGVKSEREHLKSGNKKLHSECEMLKLECEELRDAESNSQELVEECRMLRTKVHDLSEVQVQFVQLESVNNKLQTELERSRQDHSKLADEYEIDKSGIQRSLQATQVVVEKQHHDLETLRKQLHDSEHIQHTIRDDHDSQMESLQYEKDELEMRVNELETLLTQSQNNANITENSKPAKIQVGQSAEVDSLRTDHESALMKIDFLNNIIADQQKKHADLTEKIKILTDSEDQRINGSGRDDDNIYVTPQRPPPRLFCDICEVFDLHDTDDCPKQGETSEDDELLQQTQRDTRKDRPYCEICEVFGHSTAECDDEQTF